MESVTMLLWTSARGVKETGVENPGMWMVHVGVDIPKMEAGRNRGEQGESEPSTMQRDVISDARDRKTERTP